MKEHGYKTLGVDFGANRTMLRFGGDKGNKHVIRFVQNNDIMYFNLDDVENFYKVAGHGHSKGIYSHRAIMEKVIERCFCDFAD